MSLVVASRSPTQEIIATADPSTTSLDRGRSHRTSTLAIARLTTRINETRQHSDNTHKSRPNEHIDSNDELERPPKECKSSPSGADESLNGLLTSDRLANGTSQLQTSSELGSMACSPQNLWREPQSIPNCKVQVYVYPYSNSVIKEDHLKRFPVVIDIFKRNIEKMSELKLHMCEIDYTLKMCGPSPMTSHPSIIVFCTKAVFSSLRALLTSRHIASQYYLPKPSRPTSRWRSILRGDEEDPSDSQIPRFKIYFWWAKKMPRTLHWGRLENLRVYQPCHDSLAELGTLTMCGSRIAATGDVRLATLGCLVKIQSRFYGLSASHAFESIVRATPLVIGTSLGRNPPENTLSVHSTMSQKVEDLVDDVEYDTDDEKSSVESIVTSVNNPNVGPESLQDITEEIMHGNVIFPSEEFFNGTMKPDLDWALIEINNKRYKRPNAYIAVTESPMPIFFSKTASCHPGEQREIVVISSALNPKRGFLLPGKSFLGGINRPNMCEVWNIVLTEQQVLLRGDSGSLVIDLNTNEVYGHVVASNPLGEAYVVPLLATLDQIRESFHTEDVSLPETFDFEDLQEHEEKSRIQTLVTGLTASPPLDELNTQLDDMKDLSPRIRAKQSSTPEIFFRISDSSGEKFHEVRISQPDLIRRHSIGLKKLLDERIETRKTLVEVDPQAGFDSSEVAWVIKNLQLPELESLYQKNDLRALARICGVVWAYQCDPDIFKDLEIIIRPNSGLRLDSSSTRNAESTTAVSRCWQGTNHIATCGHLITNAFVLGFSEILEDEIKVAVWGTNKEVKVLAHLGIDIGDVRKVELGKLFEEVFYLIFEVDDENELLASSIRKTLKQHRLGDFSKTWGKNSEYFQHWTPHDFLLSIEDAFTPQLAQSRANDTPRVNLANLVKNTGVSILDSRNKQGDQENETKNAILDGLELLVLRRGRELAEGLMNQRNSLVQGWRDELRHLAGSSSLGAGIKSSPGTTMKSSLGAEIKPSRGPATKSSSGAELKSTLATVMMSSLNTEMKIEDSRYLAKGETVRIPQDV